MFNKRIALAFVFVLLVGSTLTALGAYSVWRTYVGAQESLQQLEELANDPSSLATRQGLSTLEAHLKQTEKELRALKGRLSSVSWALPAVSWLPLVGEDLRAAPTLCDLGLDLLQGTSSLVEGLATLDGLSPGSASDELFEQAIARLEGSRADFEAAAARFEDVVRRRQTIAPPRPNSRSAQALWLVDSNLPRLQSLTRLGLEGPVLLRSLSSLNQRVAALQQEAQDITLEPLQAMGNAQALDTLAAEVASVSAELGHLRSQLVAFSEELAILSQVPMVGGDLRPAPRVLALAVSLVGAGQQAMAGVRALEGLVGKGLVTREFGERAERAISQASVNFQDAQDELISLRQERQALSDISRLAPVLSSALETLDQGLDQLQATVQTGMDLLAAAEKVLGFDRPQTYLVLGLKEAEIRATGGFIGSVWQVTVDRGHIVGMRFMYSYEVEGVYAGTQFDPSRYSPPPEPMYKYMWAGVWLFRDSNWYPDFPTSARIAMNMYRQAQGVEVDGIIALTQREVSRLVGALGPLEVPGVGVSVDAGSIDNLLMVGVPVPEGLNPKGYAPRAWFARALGETLFARARQGLSAAEVDRLLAAAAEGLMEKDVQLYFVDEDIQGLVRARNWDGSMLRSPGDHLMVVSSNLYGDAGEVPGGNIARRVDYDVHLGKDGASESKLTVHFDNLNPPSPGECVQPWVCYWEYLRVYLPQKAELTSRPQFPSPQGSLYYQATQPAELDTFTATPNQEFDKLELGGFFALDGGDTRSFNFEYRQPESLVKMADGTYTYELLWQKQAGIRQLPVTVTLHLPQGWSVVDLGPGAEVLPQGAVRFSTRLDGDQRFQVRLRPGPWEQSPGDFLGSAS